MKKLFIYVIVSMFAFPALPCSTVGIAQANHFFMGKNYDWHIDMGHVYVNKRNMHKVALVGGDDTPAEWVSRYGSVTFNQYGREFPNGGMNEAGLAIEIMWLTDSVYPEPDERPVVNELQWIQIMLDNFATVEEMANFANEIRVSPVTAYVHYMACDRTGNCGTFEYTDGTMVVHTRDTLPYWALTNDTYEDSLNFLFEHEGFGGDRPIPQSEESLDRFVRGVHLARENWDMDSPYEMFDLMDGISQSNTVWQMTYDIVEKIANFRTSANRSMKSVDLTAIDFSCRSGTEMAPMQLDEGGFINDLLVPYSHEANAQLVHDSIMNVPIDIPDRLRRYLVAVVSQYPESVHCTE